MRRAFASLILAGGLLVMAGPTAMASTGGGFSADAYLAEGEFSDGLNDIDVQAYVGKLDGVAARQLTVAAFSQQDITCKGKGKAKGGPGAILTQVYGVTDSFAITVDHKLGTATASATLTITTDTLNTCTGQETFVDSSVSVALSLQAISGVTSTKSRTETTYPDGSKETQTDKLDSRDAGGTATFKGTTYTVGFGRIGHDVYSDVFTLPRAH